MNLFMLATFLADGLDEIRVRPSKDFGCALCGLVADQHDYDCPIPVLVQTRARMLPVVLR